MRNQLIEKIENIFKNPESLTMKQMETFVHEMLGFFETLRATISTGTENEKKEALETADVVRTRLQDLAQKAYEKTGMSQGDILKYLNSGDYAKEDFKLFQNAQQEIDDYQKNLASSKSARNLSHA